MMMRIFMLGLVALSSAAALADNSHAVYYCSRPSGSFPRDPEMMVQVIYVDDHGSVKLANPQPFRVFRTVEACEAELAKLKSS